MQVLKKSIVILSLFIIGCTSIKEEDNRKEFWATVFKHIQTEHFVLPLPPPPNGQIDTTKLSYRTICTKAVVHINTERNNYSDSSIKEISSFLKAPVDIDRTQVTVSSIELSHLDIPITFENFDTLSRENKYFARKDHCGIHLSSLLIKDDKAILSYGILYSPRAGEGFLLFLKFDPIDKQWRIVKKKSLYII